MALLWFLAGAGQLSAQQAPGLAVQVGGPSEGWQPAVEATGLLRDPALRKALESGLPLRFRLQVELWEKRLLDRLVDADEVSVALVQDPLDHSYVLTATGNDQRFTSLLRAQGALESALRVPMRPEGSGRFYYLAVLEVETLSLSDLEELRRWLRGEVRPAVQGRRSPERALGSGLRRVLIRIIGLPTRRFEARSATFTIR